MFRVFLAALLLLPTSQSFAQVVPDGLRAAHISVRGGVQRYFHENQRPVENIEVKNTDDTQDFLVQVRVEEVINPGSGSEARKFVPTDMFMVAPSRFILRSQEKRQIRLVLNKPRDDKEHVFRVSFIPVKDKGDFNETNTDDIELGVSILVSTAINVLVSPRNPDSVDKLVWERDVDGITFRNEGNISIDLRRWENYCVDVSGVEECYNMPAKRIYPGYSWRLEIPGNVPVKYGYSIYNKSSRDAIEVDPVF